LAKRSLLVFALSKNQEEERASIRRLKSLRMLAERSSPLG
jgi:hypothetical protein